MYTVSYISSICIYFIFGMTRGECVGSTDNTGKSVKKRKENIHTMPINNIYSLKIIPKTTPTNMHITNLE